MASPIHVLVVLLLVSIGIGTSSTAVDASSLPSWSLRFAPRQQQQPQQQQEQRRWGLHWRGGHCQVPCGIFDDPAMVAELRQSATTIRKAMVSCQKLNKKQGDVTAMNQLIRSIVTKEEHCQKIIDTVCNYGLCQRVKSQGVFANEQDYRDALQAHHQLLQCAVQAKQSMNAKVACHALDHAIDVRTVCVGSLTFVAPHKVVYSLMRSLSIYFIRTWPKCTCP